MEAYGAAAGAPLRAAGASPSSVTETAIWKHSFFGTPLALHEVISSCRKTSFEEIDGKKQAKDTLLGLLFHKLRSCGIAARKAGGKKGDELRGMRLALQRTPRYRPQRSPVCFPDQIHRKADAALYIKAAGMIMPRDRRIQPSLGKYRPIRSPDRQMYRIRDMKKPRAISSQTEPAQKPVYFPNVHGALRHLSVFNFCDLLPQGREQLFDLVLLQHEQKEHQRDRGKAVYAPLQIAVRAACDAKPLRHLLLCQPPAPAQCADIS